MSDRTSRWIQYFQLLALRPHQTTFSNHGQKHFQRNEHVITFDYKIRCVYAHVTPLLIILYEYDSTHCPILLAQYPPTIADFENDTHHKVYETAYHVVSWAEFGLAIIAWIVMFFTQTLSGLSRTCTKTMLSSTRIYCGTLQSFVSYDYEYWYGNSGLGQMRERQSRQICLTLAIHNLQGRFTQLHVRHRLRSARRVCVRPRPLHGHLVCWPFLEPYSQLSSAGLWNFATAGASLKPRASPASNLPFANERFSRCSNVQAAIH